MPNNLVEVIIRLVSIGFYRLLWNREATNMMKPTWGLRQGDPLSPYLFILCMERVGQWLMKDMADGRLRAVGAARRGPKLSHLFFAGDLIVFSEGRKDQF